MDNAICGITLILPHKVQYVLVKALPRYIHQCLSWINFCLDNYNIVDITRTCLRYMYFAILKFMKYFIMRSFCWEVLPTCKTVVLEQGYKNHKKLEQTCCKVPCQLLVPLHNMFLYCTLCGRIKAMPHIVLSIQY